MINVSKMNAIVGKIGDGLTVSRVFDYSNKYYLVEVKIDGSKENDVYPFFLMDKSTGMCKPFLPTDNPTGYIDTVSQDPLYEAD